MKTFIEINRLESSLCLSEYDKSKYTILDSDLDSPVKGGHSQLINTTKLGQVNSRALLGSIANEVQNRSLRSTQKVDLYQIDELKKLELE